MKTAIWLMTISTIILGSIYLPTSSSIKAHAQEVTPKGRIIEQDNQQVLARDFLLTMLSPYIDKAVYNYYKEPRRFTLFTAQIKDIKRLCDKGQFYFEATVYIDTSNGSFKPPYGLDKITLTNYPTYPESIPKPGIPNIYILKYQHQDTKTFTLPIWENCFQKKYP